MKAVVRSGAVLLACALAMSGASAQGDAARTAMADGRYVDALAAHAEVIAAAPGDAGAYAQRASVFSVLGQPDLAALDYRSAVKLKPGDAGLQLNLCLTLALSNHDLDGALGACNAAVKIEPGNYEALSARGYAQLRRGAWTAAEKDFAAALAINPASPNEMFGHGLAVIKLGRAQEGRDEIASATLDSAGLVSEWATRGFGARGEIRPGRPLTTVAQAIVSVDDPKVFLNADEALVKLANGCERVVRAASGVQRAEVEALNARLTWSGACRFGLIHGDGQLGGVQAGADLKRFAYGREVVAGDALERKLALTYQAAEKALTP